MIRGLMRPFGGASTPTPTPTPTPSYDESRTQTTAFLTDLGARRGRITPGYNPNRFIELHGGTIIEPTAFEPDAATHRHEFYYNAITNTLYKKVVTRREPGIVVAYWQKASN